MSDTQERQQPDFEPMHSGSPGKLLKSERERQGLSLEEVAIQLNLRPAVVAGLEADQYEEVPIAAYRRGYLRAYARLMGIDERKVVDAYNSQHGHSEVERKVTPAYAAKPPSRVGPWVFKLVTVLVILGLIALTLLWWQSRDGNDVFDGLGINETAEVENLDDASMSDDDGDTTQDNATMTIEEDSDLPPLPSEDEQLGLVVDEAANAGAVDTEQTASDEATDGNADSMIEPATAPDMTNDASTVANESTGVQSEEQASTDEGGEAVSPDTRRLAFVFNEESWTEVFDASGQRILVGLQSAGTEATTQGEPPFRLTIGNADGVELRYRGEQVDLNSRAAGTNVARFTLGE